MKTTYVTLKPDMARAYREKLKWMTRRVMVPQPPDWAEKSYIDGDKNVIVFDGKSRPDGIHYERSLKYGKTGDHIILGTTLSVPIEYDHLKPTELPVGDLAGLPIMTTSGTGAAFKPIPMWSYFDSDEKPEGFGKLRPARFLPNKLRDRMPRETLKIVRAERVQDITEDDAVMEGIRRVTKDGNIFKYCVYDCSDYSSTPWQDMPHSPLEAFSMLWDSINEARGYSCDSNPWVWVLGW
jgi:hypothetical protein